MKNSHLVLFCLFFFSFCIASMPAVSAESWEAHQKEGFFKKMIERRQENKKDKDGSDKGFYVHGKGNSHQETLGGRSFFVYTPPRMQAWGNVPLLIVLHGGFGNAAHIQNYIGLDPYADQGGYIIAYLNGTQVAKALPAKFQGWNAGGCCGQPQERKVDDIGFISSVIGFMQKKYGVNPSQIYGTGHSNGAMMTLRILCETDLYRNGVGISGTIQLDRAMCPFAEGKKVMNIHGAEDENLPVKGGHTLTGFNKKTHYKSQAYSKALFERSGGEYQLLLLNGADHSPETINAKLWETQNMSLPQKIVTQLGLN